MDFLNIILNLVELIIGVSLGTYIATKYIVFRLIGRQVKQLISDVSKTINNDEEAKSKLVEIIDVVMDQVHVKAKDIADDIIGYIIDKYINKHSINTAIPKPPVIEVDEEDSDKKDIQ